MTAEEIAIARPQVESWFQSDDHPAYNGNGFWYAERNQAYPVKPFFGEFTGLTCECFEYEYDVNSQTATINGQ